jgi:hypothetical protein
MAVPNALKRLLGAFSRGGKAAGAAKTAENIVGPVAGFQRRLEQAEKLIPERRAIQAKTDEEWYPGEPSSLRLGTGWDSTPEHHVLAARQMEKAAKRHSKIELEDVRASREAFEADPHNADLLGSLKNSIGQAVAQNESLPKPEQISWKSLTGESGPFTSKEIESLHPDNIEFARNHYQEENDLIADQRLQYRKPVAEGEEQSDEVDFTRTIGFSGGVDHNRVTLEEKEIAEYKARKRTFVDKGREERAEDRTSSEPYYDRMNPNLKPGEDPEEGGVYGLKVRQNYEVEGKYGLESKTDEYEEEYGYYRDGRDGKVFDVTDSVQHGERQAVGGDLDAGGEFVERDSAGNAYPKPYRIAKQEADPGAGATPPPGRPTPPPQQPASPGSPPPTPQQAASSSAGASSAPPPPPPSAAPSSPPPSPPKAPVTRGTLSTVGGDESSSLRAIGGAMGGALDPLLIGAGGGAMGFAHGALSYNEEAETDPDFKNAPGIGRINNALMEGAAGALKGVAVGAGISGMRAIGSANVMSMGGARNSAGGALSMLTGGVTGAVAGGFAGSVVPGAGTALGALMGGISGAMGGFASARGSKSMTGSFIEGFGESLFSAGVGAFRSGGGDFSEKAAGASDIINRSLFGRALNSSKGIQREISTLEGRLAGDLSEDAISQMRGMGVNEEADNLATLRTSTEKLLGEKRAQAAKGLPDNLQDEIGSKPFSLGMRDLPGIAGGLAGYIGGTAASLPVTAYKAWRSGIATPYYGYEDYSDRGAAGQVFGEVVQNSIWRGTVKPILESFAGPLVEGQAGAGRQLGGAGIGGLVGGLIGGATAGPLGAIGGAAFGARMTAGAVDRAAINVASGAEAPKAAPKSIAGRIKSAFTNNPDPGPAAVSAGADSLFSPAVNLALGVGLTGAVASTVAGALPNAFAAGAENSSAGAPMGHPMNALRNRKDPIAQSRAQMEADQSNKVRMTNPGMIGLSDIEEPYHTNTSFKPTRGKHTPGKYNDTGDLVFALSALRRG